MTRTGTLIISRCAVLAALALWTGIALAQTAAWQPTRSDGSSSPPPRSSSTARRAASPNRWLAPTQTSIRSPAGTPNTRHPTNRSAARPPKPFVPPADARQLAPAHSNNQSAALKPTANANNSVARSSAGDRGLEAVATNRQTQAIASTSAAQMSGPAARNNSTPAKNTKMAQQSPRASSQPVRAQPRPRPSASNRLFDESWIRPLKQVAYNASEPEELYAPPEYDSQMHAPGGPSGSEMQSEGEWIGTPEGGPYGGPCCDGQCGPDCGCPDCGCAEGDACGSTCGAESSACYVDLGCGLQDPEACEEVRFRVPKVHTLLLSGGVHGFKGPLDRDRDSGNFGFQEGVNMGFKVPLSHVGYQIGYQTTQSQLSGDGDTGIVDAFSQHFLTAGVFRRNRDGFQGGVAWDLLLDERDTSLDFSQLRGELSFVDCGCHEVGAMVAVNLSDDDFVDQQGEEIINFQSTDQYLLFYRMHGKRGGEGRVFAGLTDDSDGLVGADFLLPLTNCWSLQPSFTYLMPEESGGSIGAREEAWNIGINLVWHWKAQARSCHSSPYRPLFNVADNGTMIIDDRP